MSKDLYTNGMESLFIQGLREMLEQKRERDEGVNSLLDELTPEERDNVVVSAIEGDKYVTYEQVYKMLNDNYNTKEFVGLTVTFQPKYQNNFTSTQLRDLLEVTIDYRLPYARYIFYPDQDKNENFHYHGIIDIPKSERHNFKIYMTKNIGFINFSYIKDFDGWVQYMLKSKPKYEPIFTLPEIYKYKVERKVSHYKRTKLSDFNII